MSKQSLTFLTEVTIFIDAISREAANRLYRLPRKVHIFYKTKTLLKIRELFRPGCLPMRGQNRFMMTSIRRIYIYKFFDCGASLSRPVRFDLCPTNQSVTVSFGR